MNFNNGAQAYMVLAGNSNITLSNPSNGKVYRVRLTQDGTGSRTVVWVTSINWKGGSAPSLTTTPNKSDWITLVYSNGVYYGDINNNF